MQKVIKKAVFLLFFAVFIVSVSGAFSEASANPFYNNKENVAEHKSKNQNNTSEHAQHNDSVSHETDARDEIGTEAEHAHEHNHEKASAHNDKAHNKSKKPSFISKAWFKILSLQREANRQMSQYMRDVKSGDNSAVFFALGVAFIYGVIHAIGPGHGKIIVASYFIGNDAKWWQGIVMALQFAFTHVFSAVFLVWTVDKFSRLVFGKPSAEMIWVRVISYVLIFIIGLFMLIKAIQFAKNPKGEEHTCCTHPKDDGHEHTPVFNWREWRNKLTSSQGFLAVATGLAPCAGALLVMLYALANDVVFTGILVVIASAAGIAVTLAAIGIATIYLRSSLLHKLEKQGKLYNTIIISSRIIGSLTIILIGAILFTTTLYDQGIIETLHGHKH